MIRKAHIFTIAAASVVAAGCGGHQNAPKEQAPLPQDGQAVQLDPADFTSRITNARLPFASGSKWVYREVDERGMNNRVDVTVTRRTKRVIGIDTRVVHDRATRNGKPLEDTYDLYAQDRDGNVWYFGEDTKEFTNGKVTSTEGSWQAGVHGAQPGVIMPARPAVGLHYRQEWYRGHAEDAAEVLSLSAHASVPRGRYAGLLMTRDYTPLEPKADEHKYFAKGIGEVLTVPVSGPGREELVTYRRAGG